MGSRLSFKILFSYTCGMMGWSLLTNLVAVLLIYIYLPEKNSGLSPLISQFTFLGVINVLSIIVTSGRLLDVIIDPFIGYFSDKSSSRFGRRIPFMAVALIPSAIFCALIFSPPDAFQSDRNMYWLMSVLALFYISLTTYAIPFNALLPEIAASPEEKLRLSTWQSVGYVGGIVIASTTMNFAATVHKRLGDVSLLDAVQYTTWGMTSIAFLLMLLPVIFINEKKLSTGTPVSIPMKTAIRTTLRDRDFLLFLVADSSFFVAVTMITSGLMYFVTVLAGVEGSLGPYFMATMVFCSLLLYPAVAPLVSRVGKKRLLVFALFFLGLCFSLIWFLGNLPFEGATQMFILVILIAIPVAFMNVLPNAVLADIIDKSTARTGTNAEGMYFAVRYLFVKIGQTLGIGLFAMLTVYGIDKGNDLGLRLNGIAGLILCFLAAGVFSRYRNK